MLQHDRRDAMDMVHDQTMMNQWQRWALIASCVGAIACVSSIEGNMSRLWPPYLFAFLACWLICMGGMGLLALGNLTGGRWATVGRPFYLAATQTLPLVAILFVPIGLFTESVYPWATTPRPEPPSAKAIYLQTVFFCQRASGYFIIWLVLCWLLSRVSRLDMPPASTPAMRRAGAISLVLLVPTATFAAFDWSMSLEPAWYSSIYGALLSACGVLAAQALTICAAVSSGEDTVAAILLRSGYDAHAKDAGQMPDDRQPAHDAAGPTVLGADLAAIYNDLGNLLLAFLMVAAYFALSQFLIIWSGNLPSEIAWYLRRLTGGWQWVALGLVLFHFLLPFVMLLSRERKRSPRGVRRIALVLLAMSFVHLYWIVVPAFASTAATAHAVNVVTLVVLFGCWLAAFAWRTNRCLGVHEVHDLQTQE
jgi:hypothetical protein